jgi:hypothetical protein
MAMVNGTYEITSTGTAVEFFTALKDAITTYTDWTVESGGDLELTCTTSVPGATVHIYDCGGTSATGSASTGVYFEYILTSDAGSVTNKRQLYYSSSNYTTTSKTTRTIYMHVYEDVSKNIYYIEFTRYNQLVPLFGISDSTVVTTNFGVLNITNISDGTSGQTLIAGCSCYGPNDCAKTAGIICRTFGVTAKGVVMVNYLIKRSDYIVERFDNVYNCTTLSANYTWSINNKKYFAFGTNTLFEL